MDPGRVDIQAIVDLINCSDNKFYIFRNNILEAFDNQIELKLSVQFFKKSGVPFWCLLDIIPIQNEVGKVVLFLLSYKDISNTYTPSRYSHI